MLGDGIGMADLVLRLAGGSLEIALKDPARSRAGFSALADRVTIENWDSDFSKIETLAFSDGLRLNLKQVVSAGGLTKNGPAVDLTAAIVAAYGSGSTTSYDLYVGGADDDTLTGGSRRDILIGSEGADELSGGGGNDALVGGSGDDELFGGAGADTLDGGAGNDVYRFGRGDGRDTIRDEHADIKLTSRRAVRTEYRSYRWYDDSGEIGQWRTGRKRYTIYETVNDTVQVPAEAGTDTLFLRGEIGIADIVLRIAGGALEVALKDPNNPNAAFDTLADRVTIENWGNDFSKIENLTFGDGSRLDLKEIVRTYGVTNGGAAVDLIAAMNTAHGGTLPAGGNAYLGGAGDDALVGGAGDDVLKGGAGNDFYGFGRGDGRDTVRDEHTVNRVARQAGERDVLHLRGDLGIADIVLRLAGGSLEIALKDPNNPNAAFDALADRVTIENWGSDFSKIETLAFGDGSRLDLQETLDSYGVTNGSTAVDLIAAMNAAHGGTLPAGGSVYLGGAGNDVLVGGTGDDVLMGGAGADVLVGGAGRDTASYAGSFAGVRVDLAAGTASGGHARGDSLSGIENLIGSARADRLIGDDGANRLDGGWGDDRLKGGAGADNLIGGEGTDTAFYEGSDAGITVNLSAGTGSGGHAGGDTLSGVENVAGSEHDDTLTGDDGANRLHGGAGADNLYGGSGDDVLVGGSGEDVLVGGSGDDVYRFGRGDGADTIDNRGESGSDDILEFTRGIDADQLWFSRSGDDLAIRIVGTEDRVTVEDWYDGTGNRLDLELDDGRMLLAEDVRALVDAMAAFIVPGNGATEFTPAQRTALDPVIAANWRMPES